MYLFATVNSNPYHVRLHALWHVYLHHGTCMTWRYTPRAAQRKKVCAKVARLDVDDLVQHIHSVKRGGGGSLAREEVEADHPCMWYYGSTDFNLNGAHAIGAQGDVHA